MITFQEEKTEEDVILYHMLMTTIFQHIINLTISCSIYKVI